MARFADSQKKKDPTKELPRSKKRQPLGTDLVLQAGSEHQAPASVLALQRAVGNRAATKLLSEPLAVQREMTDVMDNINNIGSTVLSSGVGTGTSIGTSAWYDKVGQQTDANNNPTQAANNSNVATNANSQVLADIGLLSSGASLLTSGLRHHEARKGFQEAEKMQSGSTKDALLRTRGRQKDKSGMDVATNTLNTGGGVANVVTSGYGLANALGTATTAASNAAGVAGSVIGLPIQMFTLARTSRQAHLQRQRMERISETNEAMQALKGGSREKKSLSSNKRVTSAKSTAEQEAEDAKAEVERHTQSHGRAERRLEAKKQELAEAETRLSDAKSALSAAKGKAKRALRQTVDTEQATVNELKAKVTELTQVLAQRKDALQHAQDEHAIKSQSSKANESGHLTSTGESAEMPTLEEIAAYAKNKNKRGFTRRALGAGAAALGVAGGTIGIAAAAETFKNNSQLGSDLGVAAAVIGGAAALIGVGVGIWKTVNWFKKRKKQAAAMEEANKKAKAKDPNAQTTEVSGTYNPFKSKVDQTTERRHMATALYLYATKGSTDQRKWAVRIMSDLDPKGPWNVDKQGNPRKKGSTDEHALYDEDTASKSEVIAHLVDKLASGG